MKTRRASLTSVLAFAVACGSSGAGAGATGPSGGASDTNKPATQARDTAARDTSAARLELGTCKSKGQTYTLARLGGTAEAEQDDQLQPSFDDKPSGPSMTPRVPMALLAKYARDVVRDEFAGKLNLLRSCFPPALFERIESPTTLRIALTVTTNTSKYASKAERNSATVTAGRALGMADPSARRCIGTVVRGMSFSKPPPASLRVSCELTVHAPGQRR